MALLLLAVGRVPNTDDLGLAAAGVASTHAASSSSTIRCGRMCRYSCDRRLQWTWRLPTRRTTISRSSPTTCWNGTQRSVRDPSHRIWPLRRSAARTGRRERHGNPQVGPPGAVSGMRPMTRVSRAVEKGEAQGFMKTHRRRRYQGDSRCGDSRRWRRRGHPLHSRRHVHEGAVYRRATDGPHPSDRREGSFPPFSASWSRCPHRSKSHKEAPRRRGKRDLQIFCVSLQRITGCGPKNRRRPWQSSRQVAPSFHG